MKTTRNRTQDRQSAGRPRLRDRTSGLPDSDGITLPVASVGHGPVLLKTSNWINHIEYDWISLIFSPLFSRGSAAGFI